MSKNRIAARKRMMDEKARNPEYLKTSYEKQRVKMDSYVDERKRIE